MNREDIDFVQQNPFQKLQYILKRYKILLLMEFPQNQELFKRQNELLKQNIALSDLFDKFQSKPCFDVPSREITVNVDNITLSPDQYTTFVNPIEGSNMRIIYFCILYYIFERNPENKGLVFYQKMLRFIYQNKMQVETEKGTISDEESKVYFTKFFHSLFRSQNKRKIIVEEMSCLPQMDVLMLHLIRKMTGEGDLIIEDNGFAVMNGIYNILGFSIEFLSNETFIFQDEYVVNIRQFSQNCSFHIKLEKEENISKLRKDITFAESARFVSVKRDNQDKRCSSKKGGERLAKIKDTFSLLLASDCNKQIEQPRKPEEFVPFNGLMDSQEKLQKESLLDTFVKKEDKQKSKKFEEDPESTTNLKEKQGEYRQSLKQNKKQISSENCGLGTRNFKSTVILRNVKDMRISISNKIDSNKSCKKSPSFNTLVPNQSSSYGLNIFREFQSTKLARSGKIEENLMSKKLECNESIRIPTFIRQRTKAKEQKVNKSSKKQMKLVNLPPVQPMKIQKLTFIHQKP